MEGTKDKVVTDDKLIDLKDFRCRLQVGTKEQIIDKFMLLVEHIQTMYLEQAKIEEAKKQKNKD